MNLEVKAAIHAALVSIKANGPADKGHGICDNVASYPAVEALRHSLQVYGFFARLAYSWPGLAGPSQYYPVEGNALQYRLAKERGDLWDNPRRYELLDHMIEATRQIS